MCGAGSKVHSACPVGDDVTPGKSVTVFINPSVTLTEGCLERNTFVEDVQGVSGVEGYADLSAGPAFFGGDEHDTIGGAGAIESGCCGAFQDFHGCDVIRVDVAETGLLGSSGE